MIEQIKKFAQEVRVELAKVSWTDREELWGSTVVVVLSVFLLTLFIGFCDVVFSRTIQWFMRW